MAPTVFVARIALTGTQNNVAAMVTCLSGLQVNLELAKLVVMVRQLFQMIDEHMVWNLDTGQRNRR